MKITIKIEKIDVVLTDRNDNTLYTYSTKQLAIAGDLKAIINEAKNIITEATEESP